MHALREGMCRVDHRVHGVRREVGAQAFHAAESSDARVHAFGENRMRRASGERRGRAHAGQRAQALGDRDSVAGSRQKQDVHACVRSRCAE